MASSDEDRTLSFGTTVPSEEERPAQLIVVTGARPGARVELVAKETTIGRDPGNDLVLDSRVVSSFHARVVREASAHAIEDLDSTNGVLLNGGRIGSGPPGKALRHGDVVVLSDHTLLFVARPSSADSTDFSSIHIDREGAREQAEHLLREFPLLRRKGTESTGG